MPHSGARFEPERPESRLTTAAHPVPTRQYAASTYGYHRLIDGIPAEEFGRIEEASQALREADGPYAELASVVLGAGDSEQACQAAADWADAHPKLLEALNSPYGYAHPIWRSTDLCRPLPSDGA